MDEPGPPTRSSASRIVRSIPIRSMSLIVNTRMSASRRNARSEGSSDRIPTSATRDGSRAGSLSRSCANHAGARPSAAPSGIPCTLPGGARLRCVEISVRIDPDHATYLSGGRGQARERPERDRVVTAENERPGSVADGRLDEGGQFRAGVEDLGQESCALVTQRDRLRLRRHDVAPVGDRMPIARQALLETRVADRRRPHVDAATGLAEVERRADDRDGTCSRCGTYSAQAAPLRERRRYTSRPRRGSSVGRAHG